MGHVGGFMVANDLTARDVVIEDKDKHPLFIQVLRGKDYDSSCPTGPWLVTPEEHHPHRDSGRRRDGNEASAVSRSPRRRAK